MDNKYAPVSIFVYNRLSNTKETMEALKRNILAKDTDVFVFSDGPKDQKSQRSVEDVRKYLKSVTGFKSLNVIERPYNFYIEKNIVDGVTEIVNKFGKIIVLEDDGVSSPHFLSFMNQALNYYQHFERVMHIASFTFIERPKESNETFFWRYSENTGGGWATWKRAWEKFVWFQSEEEGLKELDPQIKRSLELDGDFLCLNALKLKPIPWDICWYIAIVKNNGLAVNSPRPLIRNNGLFNGTHMTIINRLLGKNPFEVNLDTSLREVVMNNHIEEDPKAINKLKIFYRNYGKRKRDIVVGTILKVMVRLRITKLYKRIFT